MFRYANGVLGYRMPISNEERDQSLMVSIARRYGWWRRMSLSLTGRDGGVMRIGNIWLPDNWKWIAANPVDWSVSVAKAYLGIECILNCGPICGGADVIYLDTSNPYFISMPNAILRQLKKTLMKYSSDQNRLVLRCVAKFDMQPLYILIGETKIIIPSELYFIPDHANPENCILNIQESDKAGYWILGRKFLLHYTVNFDYSNGWITFFPKDYYKPVYQKQDMFFNSIARYFSVSPTSDGTTCLPTSVSESKTFPTYEPFFDVTAVFDREANHFSLPVKVGESKLSRDTFNLLLDTGSDETNINGENCLTRGSKDDEHALNLHRLLFRNLTQHIKAIQEVCDPGHWMNYEYITATYRGPKYASMFQIRNECRSVIPYLQFMRNEEIPDSHKCGADGVLGLGFPEGVVAGNFIEQLFNVEPKMKQAFTFYAPKTGEHTINLRFGRLDKYIRAWVNVVVIEQRLQTGGTVNRNVWAVSPQLFIINQRRLIIEDQRISIDSGAPDIKMPRNIHNYLWKMIYADSNLAPLITVLEFVSNTTGSTVRYIRCSNAIMLPVLSIQLTTSIIISISPKSYTVSFGDQRDCHILLYPFRLETAFDWNIGVPLFLEYNIAFDYELKRIGFQRTN